VGRRPANLGGVGFLDPEVQLYALQAMWMARFLTTRPHPPWWTALNWVLSTYNGDRSFLGSHISGATRFPDCWQPYLAAWLKLHPIGQQIFRSGCHRRPSVFLCQQLLVTGLVVGYASSTW
jgi:hypothetical protein